MGFPSNWLTIALKLFWIKSFCILASPYLGNLSVAIRTPLQNSINKNLPFCKIRVIFKSTTRLYKFSCGRWNATYYGETCWHVNIRVGYHSGVSALTGKKSKAKTTTAIKDHMHLCDHVFSLGDFKILTSINSEFHLKIKESLLIARDKPELNRNEKPLPLYLFG